MMPWWNYNVLSFPGYVFMRCPDFAQQLIVFSLSASFVEAKLHLCRKYKCPYQTWNHFQSIQNDIIVVQKTEWSILLKVTVKFWKLFFLLFLVLRAIEEKVYNFRKHTRVCVICNVLVILKIFESYCFICLFFFLHFAKIVTFSIFQISENGKSIFK